MKNSTLKWFRYQKKTVLLAFTLVSLSIGIGCQHEQSKVGTVLDEPSNTEGVFQMAYDMETMSYTKLDNPSLKPTAMENVGMMPKVKKSAVKMTIFDDGTSDWTIKDLEPTNKIVYADQTPPDPRPKTVLTRIDRSGLARFFDKNNNEKHNTQMNIPSMKDVVSTLRGDTSSANKSVIANRILGKNTVNIGQMLENAARSGATIKSIAPNVLLITTGVTMPNGNVQTRGEHKIVETVVDTAQRIMLGGCIKNDQGEVISQVFMKYRTDTATPTLELMEQRSFNLNDPADRRTVSITSTSFSNMQVVVH